VKKIKLWLPRSPYGRFRKRHGISFRKLPSQLTLKFVLSNLQKVLFIAPHSTVKWVASAAAVQEIYRPFCGEQSGDKEYSPHIAADLKEKHGKESTSSYRYSWRISIIE
jgi:hypothetical protein